MSLQDVLHWLGQSCAVVGMLVQLSLGVSSGPEGGQLEGKPEGDHHVEAGASQFFAALVYRPVLRAYSNNLRTRQSTNSTTWQSGDPAICGLRNRANAHTGRRPGFPRGDAVGNGSAGQVVELALYLGLLGGNVVQLLRYGG